MSPVELPAPGVSCDLGAGDAPSLSNRSPATKAAEMFIWEAMGTILSRRPRCLTLFAELRRVCRQLLLE